MYIRRDTKKKTGAKPKGNGRVPKGQTYLSIAHNVREETSTGKCTKPVVFAQLGNEELIDEKMARQLARSPGKYIDERWGDQKRKPTASEIQELAHEVRRRSAPSSCLPPKTWACACCSRPRGRTWASARP